MITGADIDTLLVAPRHIDRNDFFTSFKELLVNTKGVTNIRVRHTPFHHTHTRTHTHTHTHTHVHTHIHTHTHVHTHTHMYTHTYTFR